MGLHGSDLPVTIGSDVQGVLSVRTFSHMSRAGQTVATAVVLVGWTCGCVQASNTGRSGPAVISDAGGVVSGGGTPSDGGTSNDDGGPTTCATYNVCDPAAGPPSDGGIHWAQGPSAVIRDPQAKGWVTVSSDGDCASIAPRPLPAQLSWAGPEGSAFCDPPVTDRHGNLAVLSFSGGPLQINFLRADGAAGAEIIEGKDEIPGVKA